MAEKSNRWNVAQEYEAGYWKKRAEAIQAGSATDLGFYEWRAGQLIQRLSGIGYGHLTDGGADIMEIGSGPVGLASHFPAAKRLLIDPLASTYSASRVLVHQRNPEALYCEGTGETLPTKDNAFDLVIIENCIDHVRDIDAVMTEVIRVVKPTGLVYLTVNNRSMLGYWVHRFLSRAKIDPGHPHTFTPRRFRKFLEKHGLAIQDWEVSSYWKATVDDLRSSSWKDRLKGLLGVSEYVAYAIGHIVHGDSV